jgi:dTDP-4-dehydrorhamnose reductase
MKKSDLRILVTGGSGQVGGALKLSLASLGEVIAPNRDTLDLTDGESIRKLMREVQPRWVVNAAAHTAVDKAESEPELAFAINATAPGILANEAQRIGAAMIHYSTDYIFNGSKATSYVEADPAGPLNVYGSTKLAGEVAVSESGVPHVIFRTSWVYGATGNNFVRSILRLARERDHLRIVADQFGTPTCSIELARMTAHVMARLEAEASESRRTLHETVRPVSGVYHATGAGETTWYGLAVQAIADLQKLAPGAKLATVEPIPTSEYPTSAARPLNSRLDCSKLGSVFDWHLPDWRESLSRVVAELQRSWKNQTVEEQVVE